MLFLLPFIPAFLKEFILAITSGPIDTVGYTIESPAQTDTRAMTVATALFFMVGFLTCLNDVIIPHLKSIFMLSYAEALLVQFCVLLVLFCVQLSGWEAGGLAGI